MPAVTPSQMRAALAVLMRRIDPSPPTLRESERDLLAAHANAIGALIDVFVAEPDLLDDVRERARARRAGVRT